MEPTENCTPLQNSLMGLYGWVIILGAADRRAPAGFAPIAMGLGWGSITTY
jgi:hypothetical protein